MPKVLPHHISSRQRPVSCGFCRKRKLRCSRQAPCSNCTARKVQCDLQDNVDVSSGDAKRDIQAEILDRLSRLESLLAATQTFGSAEAAPEERSSVISTTLKQSADVSLELQTLDKDVALLESIYLQDEHTLNGGFPPNRVVFKTCSLTLIAQARTYLCSHDLSLLPNTPPIRCIWLPPRHEVDDLLKKYVRIAAHYPWVLHVPSLPRLVEEIYSCLQQQRQVKPGPVILLLSILACALSSWTAQDSEKSTFTLSVAAANELTEVFIVATLDITNLSKDFTQLPLEAVQGHIILAFLLVKVEGLTRRCRWLFSSCFWMARELGLHRVDHPSNIHSEETIEREISRRVFWYLCSSDWQAAARFEGVNEGLYFWQHRQIITKRPKHVNDENMFEELPMSVPTTMSYPLHRLKISEICRHFVDRHPLASSHLGGPTNEDLMDIDIEFETLLGEVQPFFSMSQDELIAKYQLRPALASDIVQQGHTMRFLLYSQRCKIHLPFLTRGYTSSEFRFSRTRCVESARLLIQSQSHLLEAGAMNGTLFPFAGLLLGVFMASIVLFVDLCMLRVNGQENLHRNEVCQAVRLLESARHESDTIARFLNSLTEILRKHKITPLKLFQSTQDQGPSQQMTATGASTDLSELMMTPESSSFAASINGPSMMDDATEIDDNDLSGYFRDLADSFGQGVGVAEQYDWDNILADLNNSFV